MLVYTPNGNIRTIGDYLKEERLLLNHPGDAFSDPRYQSYHYYNPHGPPPGGWPLPRRIPQHNTWLAPQPAKSVEIQRGQVDEFFTNLNDGEDLAETEPGVPLVLCADFKSFLPILKPSNSVQCRHQAISSSETGVDFPFGSRTGAASDTERLFFVMGIEIWCRRFRRS